MNKDSRLLLGALPARIGALSDACATVTWASPAEREVVCELIQCVTDLASVVRDLVRDLDRAWDQLADVVQESHTHRG